MTDTTKSQFYNAVRVATFVFPMVVVFICMQFEIEPGPLVIALAIIPAGLVYLVYPLFIERVAERATREHKQRAAMTDTGQRDDVGRKTEQTTNDSDRGGKQT